MTSPNIVLIVADNLGWGEPGCYGGGALRGAPTPRIDRLAREGLLLQNFNVESDCVPTRSALMSGRHPIRTGCLQSVPPGLPQGLPRDETTLAQLLAERGYASAHYGKWHLGDIPGRYPSDRGFTPGTASRAPPTKPSSRRRSDSTPRSPKSPTSWRARPDSLRAT